MLEDDHVEEELDRKLGEIKLEEELETQLQESSQISDSEESSNSHEFGIEKIDKDRLMLNLAEYERELADYPADSGIHELSWDNNSIDDNEILKKLNESLNDTTSILKYHDGQSDNASQLLDLLQEDIQAHHEAYQKKIESLNMFGNLQSDENKLKSKINNNPLSSSLENDVPINLEKWSNYQRAEMQLAEKELMEFMSHKNEMIENVKRQLSFNEEEVTKYRESLATKIQKFFRGFKSRKVHGESLRRRITSQKAIRKQRKGTSHSATSKQTSDANNSKMEECVNISGEETAAQAPVFESQQEIKMNWVMNNECNQLAGEIHINKHSDANISLSETSDHDIPPRSGDVVDDNDDTGRTNILDLSSDETSKITKIELPPGKYEIKKMEVLNNSLMLNEKSKSNDDDDDDGDFSPIKTRPASVKGQPLLDKVENYKTGKKMETCKFHHLIIHSSNGQNTKSQKQVPSKLNGEIIYDGIKQKAKMKQTEESEVDAAGDTKTNYSEIVQQQHKHITTSRKSKTGVNETSHHEMADFGAYSQIDRSTGDELKCTFNEALNQIDADNYMSSFQKRDKSMEINATQEASCHDHHNNHQSCLATLGVASQEVTSTKQVAMPPMFWEKIANMEQEWRRSFVAWRVPTCNSKQSTECLLCPLPANQLEAIPNSVIFCATHANDFRQITHLELSCLPEHHTNTRSLSSCINLVSLSITHSHLEHVAGVGKCQRLECIDLSENKIEFMEFSNMTRLLHLDLHGNMITGVHNVGGCSRLRYLNLAGNRITRLSNMDSLVCLQYLNVSNNQLTSCKGLTQLRTLQFLDLSQNFLSSMMDEVQELGLLSFLDVRSNNINEIPVSKNNILLMHLNVDENELEEFELNLWLPYLTQISVKRNRISSMSSLQFCNQLQSIDLSLNQLSECQDVIGSLLHNFNLRNLLIRGNPFTEEESFRKLLMDSLTFIEILDNEKTGSKTTGTESEPHLKRGIEFDDLSRKYMKQIEDVHNFIPGDRAKSLADKSQIISDLFDKCLVLAVKLRKFHEEGFIPDDVICNELIAQKEMEAKGAVQGDPENGEKEHKARTRSPTKADCHGNGGVRVHPKVKGRDLKKLTVAERIKRNQSNETNLANVSEDDLATTPPIKYSCKESLRKEMSLDSKDGHLDGYIGSKAAVKIQALWRGHRMRRQVKETLERVRQEFAPPEEVNIEFKSSVMEDSDDADDEETIRMWDHRTIKMKNSARLKKLEQTKQAWMEGSDEFYRESMERYNASRREESPASCIREFHLPSEVSSRRQSLRGQCSAREMELIREWGFKDETTKELFLRRMRRMERIQNQGGVNSRGTSGRRVFGDGSRRRASKEDQEFVGNLSSRSPWTSEKSFPSFPRIESAGITSTTQSQRGRHDQKSRNIIDHRLPMIGSPSASSPAGTESGLRASPGWGSGKKRMVPR